MTWQIILPGGHGCNQNGWKMVNTNFLILYFDIKFGLKHIIILILIKKFHLDLIISSLKIKI